MNNRAVHLSVRCLVVGAAVAGIYLGVRSGPTWANEASAGPPAAAAATEAAPRKSERASDKATAAAPAAPRAGSARREARRAPGADSDMYRCHPNEDIACTVVRETPEGMTIVTMRPGGATAIPASWSVVSGTPPGANAYPGGIIYVVPQPPTGPPRFDATARSDRDATLVTANDAPILD